MTDAYIEGFCKTAAPWIRRLVGIHGGWDKVRLTPQFLRAFEEARAPAVSENALQAFRRVTRLDAIPKDMLRQAVRSGSATDRRRLLQWLMRGRGGLPYSTLERDFLASISLADAKSGNAGKLFNAFYNRVAPVVDETRLFSTLNERRGINLLKGGTWSPSSWRVQDGGFVTTNPDVAKRYMNGQLAVAPISYSKAVRTGKAVQTDHAGTAKRAERVARIKAILSGMMVQRGPMNYEIVLPGHEMRGLPWTFYQKDNSGLLRAVPKRYAAQPLTDYIALPRELTRTTPVELPK